MQTPIPLKLTRRLRRLRRTPEVRALLQETRLTINDLVAPLFVKAGSGSSEPVASMPEVYRYNLADLVQECQSLHEMGLKAVALFPCISPELKDSQGSYALDDNGLIPKSVRALKEKLPSADK